MNPIVILLSSPKMVSGKKAKNTHLLINTMTYDEFYNCIEQLPKEVTNRDLETYLLALY